MIGCTFVLFVFAGGSSPSPREQSVQTTMLEDKNKAFDRGIDVAAALIVYQDKCAKLPAELKKLAEDIVMIAPELTLAAGVKTLDDHELRGNTAWCAHWRGVIKRTMESM
jgi:hypothetical protein